MRKSAIFGIAAVCLALPLVDPSAHGAVAAPPAGCADATPAAVAALFDARVPPWIGATKVPGAVVSVVAGGERVFGKGYGLADVAHGVPMDAETSAMRVASISKLFTFTAVMQQVQAGRLDLGADVNTYLTAFKVPATYPRPITLLDLMDHTSGFEDRVTGIGARSAADVPPLGDVLAALMPARIRPPGEISAYSNYGAALAGYIVAQVSGEPYDEYVRRHILEPLGMAHTSATEPPPFAVAHSYDTDETPPREVPFTFDLLAPDGSISTSANDMAAFMLAHLDHDGGELLSPATAALMHQRSFAADPRLGGYAHGFVDRTMNGHRVLMHDGGWEAFGSVMILVPDCGLGLFASFNSTAAGDALTAILPAFLDRFAPPVAAPEVAAPATGAPAPGFYVPTRHNESTVERLLVLTGPLRLTVAVDGTVRFAGKEWDPAGGGLYRQRDGADHLVARGSYIATDGPAYERMSPAETIPVNLAVLAAFVVVALSIPVYFLWRLLRRRTRPVASSRAWRTARWLAGGACLLGLAFLVLLALTLAGDTSDFLYGAPLSFRLLLVLPMLVLAAYAAAIAATVRGWDSARLAARMHQVAALGGLAALTWFLWQWNLIGWQL
ncbi:MAG TPA: serine hydrolase domain-containing protein [Dactylosporangium sp.]|nr:serine hydrolase domain-containing protein [Dactylosporangium sp.]